MNFVSKKHFLEDAEVEWRKLSDLLERIPDDKLLEPGLYAGTRSAIDVLTHLHEWHNMCLRWYKDGLEGTPDMPTKGYTWAQCPALNESIYQRYKSVSLTEARRLVRTSHAKTIKLLKSLSERELLEPGYYAWCGKSRKLPLTSYFHPNTSGHYRWAQKKLKPLVPRRPKSPST